MGSAGEQMMGHVDAQARAVNVGPGRDPSSQMGPIITPESRDRIVGLIDAGESQGGEVVVDQVVEQRVLELEHGSLCHDLERDPRSPGGPGCDQHEDDVLGGAHPKTIQVLVGDVDVDGLRHEPRAGQARTSR